MTGTTYTTLRDKAARWGLIARGGTHTDADSPPPKLADGTPAASVVLLGNAGAALWPVFMASPEARDGAPDGLDRWTRRVIDGLAAEVGATAVYPFGGPPFQPFMRWAQRAEPVVPSPIGMLIHPDYGLWHAYRGALLFAARLDLPPRPDRPAPCETCAERPCRTTCPVDAFTDAGYAVDTCAAHIARPEGADCLGLGCRARRACPAGADYRYAAEQAEWHMRAFLAARQTDAEAQ